MRTGRVSALLLICASLLFAEEKSLIEKISEKFDDLYKSKSAKATMEMYIKTPHWERTLTMKSWSLGQELMLVKILSPKKEKNIGTLKNNTKMWNYLPKTNKVMKIPPSMMMSGWMGSDFTNDDLVREYTLEDDYITEEFRPEGAKDDELYIKCTPKEGTEIIWGYQVIAVRKSDYIPIWQKNFDEHGELARTMNFKDIRDINGKTIPMVMELIPADKEGNLTKITYKEITFDIDIKESFFSMKKLREPVSGE